MAEIKPTVISTFAGCGGSSLGYHLAGFQELLAVEWDDNAAATFKLNFPDVPLYHGDIAKLSVEECLARSGLQDGQLDVFDGSPPCQGFSTGGNRKFNDLRNGLFKEYARLLTGLQPKVFVMENVTGMIKGYMKQAYLKIIVELRDCGYQAQGQVLNAMHYNVPQSRERVIIIGVRNDLGLQPSHPKPQTKPSGIKFDDNPDESLYLDDEQFNKINRHRINQRSKGNGFGWQQVTESKPCHTILKNMMIVGSNTRLIYDKRIKKYRYLADLELKRAGSFPDNFKFISRESAIERIGNSVPPNMMKAIALHIKQEILAKSM